MGKCHSKKSDENNQEDKKGDIQRVNNIICENNVSDESKESITGCEMHLIVDDSDINRMVLSKYLKRIDIECVEARNGSHAVEIINRKKNKFNIIWMDIQMPIMDGLTCTKKLRNELNYDGVIIGLTGHVDIDSLNDCKQAGMNTVIAKPVNKEILYMHINEYKN